MKCPITLTAAHWWYYFSPRWWNQKRKVDAYMAYLWTNYQLENKISDAIHESLVNGHGQFYMDWIQK